MKLIFWRRAGGLVYVEGDLNEIPSQGLAFPIASCSKYLVAYLFLKLHEKGELSVFDPITKYLPEISTKSGMNCNLTLLNLLSHTSGIPDLYSNIETKIDNSNVVGLCIELAVLSMNEQHKNYFGKEYSNTNYILLGECLRRHFGNSVSALFKINVFGPLSIDGAMFGTIMRPKEMLVRPKIRGKNAETIDVFTAWGVDDLLLSEVFVDGNILLTFDDIKALVFADFGLTYLSIEAKRILKGKLSADFPHSCGVNAAVKNGESGLGHSGFWLGYQSDFFISDDVKGTSYFAVCDEMKADEMGNASNLLPDYISNFLRKCSR